MTQPARSEPDPDIGIGPLLELVLDPAFGFCMRLTGNRQDAEDLVQEAALRACRGFDSFQAGTNFKAWFFKIVVNAFYERSRRKRPEQSTVAIDDVPPRYLYARATELGLDRHHADPARFLMKQLGEQIERALERLPEEYRIVCNMYFVGEFMYREIADMLGIPIGTVRSRLHRGRKLLQKALWDIAVEQGIVPVPGQ